MKPVQITTTTEVLARAMFDGCSLDFYNSGTYEGTTIPLRRIKGKEIVTISGTTSGARVCSTETWDLRSLRPAWRTSN